MNMWRAIIALSLCELLSGFVIDLDRQFTNSDSVGVLSRNRTFNISGNNWYRRQMAFLEAIGQGIGGMVNSWLGSYAHDVGSVLGGISETLVTVSPPVTDTTLNNAVTESSSSAVPGTQATDVQVTSEETPVPAADADDDLFKSYGPIPSGYKT